MPRPGAFVERLLALEVGQVPAAARPRLRRFLGSAAEEGQCEATPPAAEASTAVAVALL